MTTPRNLLVDPKTPLCYHLVSRCVRRGWLCGFDPSNRRDYSHRKDWLISRLNQLGQAFAVDIYAFAIMSNHFHLVVYYDPTAPMRWTDLEVAERWLCVCPPKHPDGTADEGLKQFQLSTLLQDPERLELLREKLGSLSLFMKLLKQPIARRANLEDQCSGHFFEQRFYSGALLSNEALLAAMAYVDLNPIRAKIAQTLVDCRHTSIDARLQERNHAADLHTYLLPVISGINTAQPIHTITLAEYVTRLEVLTQSHRSSNSKNWRQDKLTKWRSQVAVLRKRQRAFGSILLLKSWISARGLQLRESPLPE